MNGYGLRKGSSLYPVGRSVSLLTFLSIAATWFKWLANVAIVTDSDQSWTAWPGQAKLKDVKQQSLLLARLLLHVFSTRI